MKYTKFQISFSDLISGQFLKRVRGDIMREEVFLLNRPLVKNGGYLVNHILYSISEE